MISDIIYAQTPLFQTSLYYTIPPLGWHVLHICLILDFTINSFVLLDRLNCELPFYTKLPLLQYIFCFKHKFKDLLLCFWLTHNVYQWVCILVHGWINYLNAVNFHRFYHVTIEYNTIHTTHISINTNILNAHKYLFYSNFKPLSTRLVEKLNIFVNNLQTVTIIINEAN